MASPLMRNFAALLGTQAGGRVIRVLYLVVIARYLEPSAVGIYAYGTAFYISLMVFATFGQELLMATHLRRKAVINRSILVNSFAVRLISISIATLAGVCLAWLLEGGQATLVPVLFFVLTIVPRSMVQMVRETYVARERAGWIPRYEFGFRATEMVAGFAFLTAGYGVAAVAAVHVGVYSIEAALSWRRLLRDPEVAMNRPISWRMMRAIAAISIMFLASIGLLNLYGQLGVIMLKFLRADIASVGQFGVAMQLLMSVLILATTFGISIVPAIIRIRQRGGERDLKALTTVVKLALLSGLCIALLAQIIAPLVIPFILGVRFSPAAELFTLLSWVTGPYAAVIVSCQALNAFDRRGRAAALALLMNVTLIIVLGLLDHLDTARAAAISVAASAVIGCLFGAYSLQTLVSADGNKWWWIPLLLTAVAFMIVNAIDAQRPILGVIILACLGVLLKFTHLIEKDEILHIKERFPTLPTRAIK